MKRNNKNYIVVLVLILLVGISIGYAELNTTLNINCTSIISANVWDVGLDNLNVTAGSVAAIKEPTLDNATTTSFEVKLDNKEEFYEFTVDVVNRGEHDAKLGSLVETTGLTTEQEQYFEHTVTYQNNEPIQVNQLVKKDEFVRLKSKVEYKEEVNISSVPESVKTLKLDIKMNYDLDDGNGVSVNNNGRVKVAVAYGEINEIGTIVKIDSEQFYIMGYDGDNVKLLSKYNLHVGNQLYDDEEVGVVPIENPTGKQSSSAIGYFAEYSLENPVIGVTEFSSTGYFSNTVSSYPAYVYNSNSILYDYIENYKEYLLSFGLFIKEARLISLEELENLGCKMNELSCVSALNWVYLTSYWSGSAFSKDALVVVDNSGYFGDACYFGNDSLGVRPVIVIHKNELFMSDKHIIEFTINGTSYQAEEGMTWGEWVDSEYMPDGWIASSTLNEIWSREFNPSYLYYFDEKVIFSKKIINNGNYTLKPNGT